MAPRRSKTSTTEAAEGAAGNGAKKANGKGGKAPPLPIQNTILAFLENIPLHLREGPWSPVAHLVLVIILGYIILTFEHAADSYDLLLRGGSSSSGSSSSGVTPAWLQPYRLVAGLYGVGMTATVLATSGVWPLASYTLTSWNLATLRNLLAFVGGLGWAVSPQFQLAADVVRFPALVGCSITVTVWWLVLVPIIHVYSGTPANRKRFWDFNGSFPLLNLHLFNLPLCATEFLFTGRCLSFFDLWAALAIAYLYVLFYLNVLDANGLHFYIVFTPRTVWCWAPYTIILLSYVGLYHGWNRVLSSTGSLSC